MHQQFAEARLVQAIEFQCTHWAAVLGERLRGCTALGGDEIADGLAGESGLAGGRRESGVEAWTAPGGADRDHREQFVAGTGDEELELAMLVDRPERGYRRRAL